MYSRLDIKKREWKLKLDCFKKKTSRLKDY